MKLFPSLQKRYTKERFTAVQAQRLAQEIAFGPIVFQVSRLMPKFGIFRLLSDNREGMSLEQISQATGLSRYAAQVLLEASLTIGTLLVKEDRYLLAKAGWFLLNDEMARVNMDFNQDVNYKGLFHLEEALVNSRPEGLKELGDWPRYRKAGLDSIISIQTILSIRHSKLYSAIRPILCSMWVEIPEDGPLNAYNIIKRWKLPSWTCPNSWK